MLLNTVGIFHGYGGYRENSWLTWLNKQLLNKGITTIYPSFPFLGSSTIESWYEEFAKHKHLIKTPVSLVGHSAGTTFSLYTVQKNNIMYEKLILVCPLDDINGADMSGLLNRSGKESEIPFIRNFVHQHFDYEIIQSRVKEFVFVLSDNDPRVPYNETMNYFKKKINKAKFVTLHNAGHVNEKAGITELPQVLEELL